MKTCYNFGAGPAMLPQAVLEEIKQDLPYWQNSMSIMETNHRSKEFIDLVEKTTDSLRYLLNIPPNYKLLFIHGGARQQFSMIPDNWIKCSPQNAGYIISGIWSKIAYQDAFNLSARNIISIADGINVILP